MRLENYLIEEKLDRTKEVSLDFALDFAKKNKDFLKGSPIYRGLRNNISLYAFVEPEKYTRVSANTENYYTLMIDNSPNWEGYPKRSKSIICSSSKSGASGYGNVYRVIPKNGAKIGVCSSDDFWG